MDDANSSSIAPITTVPRSSSSSSNDIPPVIGDGGRSDAYIPCPEDRNQPGPTSSEESFPEGGGQLFGLPPCGIENLDDPILMSAFQNSFPILTIRPVKIFRPETMQGATQTEYLAAPYKFAIKTDGGTTYGISNEYGSSMIEETFTNMAQFESIGQLIQFAKTNRNLGNVMNSLPQSLADKLKITNDELHGMIQNANNAAGNNDTARSVIKTMSEFGTTALRGMFFGQKIDIPNIWKGSSSNISQQVTISLHCFDVNVNSEYERKIIQPLKILLRLAAPYARKVSDGSGNSGGGGSGSQEIITYENPPYVEASVDGLFKTKIGGISDFNVAINFADQALCKGGRPAIVTVNLTITDLYNAIIWTDEEHKYAPNGLGITNFLKDHDTDPIVMKIDEKAKYMFMPDGGALEDSRGTMPWRSAYNNENANAWDSSGRFNSPSRDPNWGSSALGTTDISMQQEHNINTSNKMIPSDTYNVWHNNAYLNSDSNGNLFTDGPTAYSMSMLSEKQYTEIAKQEVNYRAPSSYGGFEF